jgi:DNA-binding XRE family transcriptional regulator
MLSPDQIRTARTDARLTRAAMAHLVGVSEQTIKNWETGKRRQSEPYAQAFLAALNRVATPTISGRDENDWDRWRTIRELAGMTPAQMALSMDVDEVDIVEWERPKRYPTIDHRARYEAMLNKLTGGRGLDAALSTQWKKAREAAGLSRDDMADKLGVAKKVVWEFDTGAAEPNAAQRKVYEALQAG